MGHGRFPGLTPPLSGLLCLGSPAFLFLVWCCMLETMLPSPELCNPGGCPSPQWPAGSHGTVGQNATFSPKVAHGFRVWKPGRILGRSWQVSPWALSPTTRMRVVASLSVSYSHASNPEASGS